MKNKFILLSLILLPLFAAAQVQDTYIRLTNPAGQLIRGESVARFYENQIPALTLQSGGKNNTQVSFTFRISGAAAELKALLNSGELMPAGEINTITAGMRTQKTYTIKMEGIRVTACSETIGCNQEMVTTVTLQATRIGWIYYQADKNGTLNVTSKYGYDASTRGPWTNF